MPCGAADLDAARGHYEAALAFARRLSDAKRSDAFRGAIRRRVLGLARKSADCALALARRHLLDVRPSSLMHELRHAATALAVVRRGDEKGGGDNADVDEDAPRRAALWYVAAAFARGVAHDRFKRSAAQDKGAKVANFKPLLSRSVSARFG